MLEGILRQAKGDKGGEGAKEREVAGGKDKKKSTHSTLDVGGMFKQSLASPKTHEDVTDCKCSTFRGNTTRIWGI